MAVSESVDLSLSETYAACVSADAFKVMTSPNPCHTLGGSLLPLSMQPAGLVCTGFGAESLQCWPAACLHGHMHARSTMCCSSDRRYQRAQSLLAICSHCRLSPKSAWELTVEECRSDMALRSHYRFLSQSARGLHGGKMPISHSTLRPRFRAGLNPRPAPGGNDQLPLHGGRGNSTAVQADTLRGCFCGCLRCASWCASQSVLESLQSG